MDTLVPLTIGATLLCCVLAVAGVHACASGTARQAALVERLSRPAQAPPTGRRRVLGGVDRRLRGTRLGRRVERELAATGLGLTPGEFLLCTAVSVAGMWLLASSLLAAFFGPVAALVALWGAFAFLDWQRRRRTERFVNQLPELARVLANATQAGLALRTALAMAAEELEAPAGEELGRVADRLAVGHSVDEALDELAERLPSRELAVLVTTLVLSNKAGGAVVTSLRNLTRTLEERKETRREVRTQLAQVTGTAYTVPAMGVGALLLMDGIWDGALDRITASAPGQGALLVAMALYAVGFLLVRRMGKIEV